MKKTYYALVWFVILGVVISTSFAYASQAESLFKRGDGTGQVSGITVTDIEYHLHESDPTRVESVTFTVYNFQGSIFVELVSTSGNFYPCLRGSESQWECQVNGTVLSDIDEVRVVARGS